MTQQEWEPGTVAMVNGEAKPRVLDNDGDWYRPGIDYIYHHQTVTVRPLLVLDPDDPDQMRELVDNFFVALSGRTYRNHARDIDDMRAAVVTMLPKPTPVKPAEPTGLGAVVEDAEGKTWVRGLGRDGTGVTWIRADSPLPKGRCPWSQVNAVKVLSEGVTT